VQFQKVAKMSDFDHKSPSQTTVSEIDVTAKTFFERFYLVPGMSPFEPRVKCPCAPASPPFAEKRFLDFCKILLPGLSGPSIFCHHDSPSNLAESWYPRPGPNRT